MKSDFYAAAQEKVINVSDYTSLEKGEIEDLLPKQKMAKVVARFLPRPEDVDDEFDDVIVDNIPLCDQIEKYAEKYNIPLNQGWKVRLAIQVKKEIQKGQGKIIDESDMEFEKVVDLFKKL